MYLGSRDIRNGVRSEADGFNKEVEPSKNEEFITDSSAWNETLFNSSIESDDVSSGEEEF